MDLLGARRPTSVPVRAGLCGCQSPVCPLDHATSWEVAGDPAIGMAVGVRRVVVMPVPPSRRRLAFGLPVHLRRRGA